MTAELPPSTLPPTTFIAAPAPRRRPLAVRLLRNPVALVSLVYLLALVLVAVIGPALVPYDPATAVLRDVFAPAGPEHLLGSDSAGRDILSRLVVASSVSLAGATLTVVVAVLVGVPAGLIAGYRGGWFDTISTWLIGLILSLPGLVVLLAVRAAAGPSTWLMMGVFGLLVAPAYFRVVYGAVRAVREELYIDAATVAGLSDVRIIGRHVLSAVRAPVVLLTAGIFAVGIAIQATIDFLGLGDASMPTWGGILGEGFFNIYRAPSLFVWPTLAIGLTCLAFSLVGIALRDELELAGKAHGRRGAGWVAPSSRPAAPIVHPSAVERPRALLEVEGLSVAYRRGDDWSTVVDDVALCIAPGEVHALIGESGSGKTQTAWSILGLLPDGGRLTAGAIRFDGDDLRALDAKAFERIRGRRIAYIPQEPLSNLDPSSTVGAHLTEPLRVVLGLSAAEARVRALDLLARVGIADPARVYRSHPHEISGGMAQRVLIAGAVSCEPSLIIADEPTTALDVTVQAEILELLRDLRAETGVAMLLVTHNFGVVADLADRVSVMRTGSIVETGPVSEVFGDPRHEYTKGLLGALLHDAPARPPLPDVTA